MSLKSGWCLRPLTESSREQHELCPKNFATSVCDCDCGHKGEKEKPTELISSPDTSRKRRRA